MVGLVALVTRDASAAEDATQEAYVRAYSRWPKVSTLDRPDLWVARVATRIAIDRWRRQRRETELQASSPADFDDSVQNMWVRWGLDDLSPRQRALIVMHHVEGHSLASLSLHTGTSTETIKTHLKRGRARLRKLLRADIEE